MSFRNFAFGYGVLALAFALGASGCGDDDDKPTGASGGAAGSNASGGAPQGGGGEGGGENLTLAERLNVVAGSDVSNADGSESKPFASIYDAITAIEKASGWEGTIFLREGKHELPSDVIIPPQAKLEIEAGTTVAGAYKVSIHAQNDISAIGTEEKPIVFTWLEEGMYWGSLTNFTPTSQHNVFEYVTFEHGYETNFQDIAMRGALSLNKASAHISHCTFQNNEGDDGLNIKASNSLIEYSLFKDNISDGLDSDGVGSPEVAFCTFDGNGNDNLDLGEGTKLYLHDSLILNAGDKGISNGDGCTTRIEHNIIANGVLGIGIKDDADPVIRNNTLYNNEFGIRVYHHVAEFGGGKGSVSNNIIWGSAEGDVLYETGTTSFAYNCISSLVDVDGNDVVDNDGNKLADMTGILSKGSGCDDPLFADAENLDFHLKSSAGRLNPENDEWVEDDATSPCIDGGDPDAEVGDEPKPNGSRIDLGRYGGTEEASKSP